MEVLCEQQPEIIKSRDTGDILGPLESTIFAKIDSIELLIIFRPYI